MSVEISKVPIESSMEQVSEDTSKNDNDKEEDKQFLENTENNATNENNDPIINHENKKDDEYPDENKKKRGRPKGSINKPKAKATATATESRAKAKNVTNAISDSDTLPAYVQQSPDYTMPQPQDLASQLFGLLQRHEHERTNRRRATYASWMTRF